MMESSHPNSSDNVSNGEDEEQVVPLIGEWAAISLSANGTNNGYRPDSSSSSSSSPSSNGEDKGDGLNSPSLNEEKEYKENNQYEYDNHVLQDYVEEVDQDVNNNMFGNFDNDDPFAGLGNHADGDDSSMNIQLPVVLSTAEQVLLLLGHRNTQEPYEFIWNAQFNPSNPLANPCVAPCHSLGSVGEFLNCIL